MKECEANQEVKLGELKREQMRQTQALKDEFDIKQAEFLANAQNNEAQLKKHIESKVCRKLTKCHKKACRKAPIIQRKISAVADRWRFGGPWGGSDP